MLSSDSIPVLSVGMFDSAGKPCCGENQVALRIQVTKGVKEYALSGFLDKYSTTGAFMTVEFTNLKLVDNTAVGEFNVTVSTFYLGVPVKYTVCAINFHPTLHELVKVVVFYVFTKYIPHRCP